MALFFHIVIAFVSLGFAAYMVLLPSKTKLRITYGLVAATLASGTYLLVIAPAHMLEACMMGMAYLAVVTFMTVSTRAKLAKSSLEK